MGMKRTRKETTTTTTTAGLRGALILERWTGTKTNAVTASAVLRVLVVVVIGCSCSVFYGCFAFHIASPRGRRLSPVRKYNNNKRLHSATAWAEEDASLSYNTASSSLFHAVSSSSSYADVPPMEVALE